MDTRDYLNRKKDIVDKALDTLLPGEDEYPQTLHRAMRYSVFAGGKRIRPVLTMAAAEAVDGNGDDVIEVACAMELIHTYSLIHDDLPAMDDDEMRRGIPTCHKAFGEAPAILAGDALLTYAFELALKGSRKGEEGPAIRAVGEIARAAGSMGMVGGQIVDIESEGKAVDLAMLEFIHTHKTGALIRASVRSGAIIAGSDGEMLDSITRYGEAIGLAFQITDDILDVEGERDLIGKNTRGDEVRGKATYPAVLGLGESKRRAREWMDIAISALEGFDGKAEPLRCIARYVVERRW